MSTIDAELSGRPVGATTPETMIKIYILVRSAERLPWASQEKS